MNFFLNILQGFQSMIIIPYFLIDQMPYKIELILAASKTSWIIDLVTVLLLAN